LPPFIFFSISFPELDSIAAPLNRCWVRARGLRGSLYYKNSSLGSFVRLTDQFFHPLSDRGSSALSTSANTVAMKFCSFTMRRENPAWRQTAITSSNRAGAPLQIGELSPIAAYEPRKGRRRRGAEDYAMSNRSRFITLFQATTKSLTNFFSASELA
jgi:hypothetical protein